MNTRPIILIPIIAIGIFTIPLTLSIIQVSGLYLEDASIGTVHKEPTVNNYMTNYYYTETFVCATTFLGDDTWYTHQNFLQVIWRKINITHYTLNISMESKNRDPDHILLFTDNDFGIKGNVTFKENTYNIDANFDPYEGIFLTYFTLANSEKLPITLDLFCNNTHNSDLGDVTTSGSINMQMLLFDPSYNDSTQALYITLLVISILSMIGLGMSIWVLIYREKLKVRKENQFKPLPQIRPHPSSIAPQATNPYDPVSVIQKCSQCGLPRVAGAEFCTACGNKHE